MNPERFAMPAALLAIALWLWLAMMFVHELGHVLAAWATGGVITSVELRPGHLSHTLVEPNPRPSVVLFGGFLVGWLAPQLTVFWWRSGAGQAGPVLLGPVLRAWAAFCLLAGGAYLAIGGTERLTDTGQLVRVGWSLPGLVAVGAAVAVIGYARSRSAWIAIAQRLEAKPVGWRVAAGWWAVLAAWCGVQTLVHFAVQNR